MINRLAKLIKTESAGERLRPNRNVYQPQPPMGFVRRTDPSFGFLNRR